MAWRLVVLFLLSAEWGFAAALRRYDSFIGSFPPLRASPGPSSLTLPAGFASRPQKLRQKFVHSSSLNARLRCSDVPVLSAVVGPEDTGC